MAHSLRATYSVKQSKSQTFHKGQTTDEILGKQKQCCQLVTALPFPPFLTVLLILFHLSYFHIFLPHSLFKAGVSPQQYVRA